MTSRLITVAITALAITACGSVSGRAAPTAMPSAAPTQLVNADAGGFYSMHVGDTILVALRVDDGFQQWSHPVSSNQAVLLPVVDVRAAAVLGMTLAKFQAAGPGTATLHSAAGVNCTPGSACPALARAWQVTIRVS